MAYLVAAPMVIISSAVIVNKGHEASAEPWANTTQAERIQQRKPGYDAISGATYVNMVVPAFSRAVGDYRVHGEPYFPPSAG